ncbi:MAG: hypothetical protein IJG42_06755 [Muribaculaceae bacterium]|nr:hypothetical protein [Muribaculaceae bacterium]
MKRELQFLTSYISKTIIESKLEFIGDAFESDDSFDEVPNEPGIYIMVAKSRNFVYPQKDSPVFYIGTSCQLRRRLKTHLKHFKEAKDSFKFQNFWLYSRYNYAVAFGADIYYMRITGRENEKALESKAIEGFYDKYGALPVGNGAFSFRK